MDSKEEKAVFKVRLNLMVKNLLLTTIGTCKFTMMHDKHPLAAAISQFKLIDDAALDKMLELVKTSRDGKELSLSLDDEILIYTIMDITCKVYLTDLGDELQSLNRAQMDASKSNFADIRSTVLKGCQFVMEGLREKLIQYPEFEDRVDILENYILV